MGLAAIDGSISAYNILPYPEEVVLTKNGRMTIITPDTFFNLYTLLGDGYAALKSEVVQYELWHRGKSVHEYPKWVKEELYKNNIFFLAGDYYFYNDGSEKLMEDNGILLRNDRGDVTYISLDTFNMLYTVRGGCI